MKTPKSNYEQKVVEKLVFLNLGRVHNRADMLLVSIQSHMKANIHTYNFHVYTKTQFGTEMGEKYP